MTDHPGTRAAFAGHAHPPTKAKAKRMTPHIADLVRAAGRKLSDRVHAPADDRARTLGWTVTETPVRLGLRGRRYHDPRFAARRQDRQDEQPRKGWTP
jgi:hypothetical protein